MGDKRVMNKYYPPEWDPKKGSINTYRGSHYLGKRAKKLSSEGILIVRFEMPYNVQCTGCKTYIAMGVRFNVEKKVVGKYFTTNIFSFKMNCYECNQEFEIETDPKNTDYKIISGLRKKETSFKEEENSIQFNTEEEKDKLHQDTLYKLEYQKESLEKYKEKGSQLDQLKEFMDKRTVNDYQLSSLMRKNFREKKKEEILEVERLKAKGINIPLEKENQDDRDQAKKVEFSYNSLKRKLDNSNKLKRELKLSEPIIQSSSSSSTSSTSSSSLNPITSTTVTIHNNNNGNNSSSNSNTNILSKEKREAIIKKKSKIDPSLFKNNQPSKVNNLFSSNLFN